MDLPSLLGSIDASERQQHVNPGGDSGATVTMSSRRALLVTFGRTGAVDEAYPTQDDCQAYQGLSLTILLAAEGSVVTDNWSDGSVLVLPCPSGGDRRN